MNTPTNELTVLASIAYNNIATSATLSQLVSQNCVTPVLAKLVKEGKIQKKKIEYKPGKGRKRIKRDYYILTQKGFLFLLSFPSFSFLSSSNPLHHSSSLFDLFPPSQYLSYTPEPITILKTIREITANTYFQKMDECITLPIYIGPPSLPPIPSASFYKNAAEKSEQLTLRMDDDIDGEDNFFEYAETDAITQEMTNQENEDGTRETEEGEKLSSILETQELSLLQHLSSSSFPLYLFLSSSIFRHDALRNKQITLYKSICYTQFSGIVSSTYTSYLVYVASTEGLSWNKKVLNIEKNILSFFRLHYRLNHQSNAGILLVRTPRDLARVYYDKARRRREKDDLNHSLSSLFTIPLQNSQLQMQHILLNDITKYKADFLRTIVSTGSYTFNRSSSSFLFPVIHSSTGDLCFYGFDMDLMELKRCQKYCDENNISTFRIICRSYQIPYYQALFPTFPIDSYT